MTEVRGSLGDAGRDLLLGGACVGCGRAGRVLCPSCAASLPRRGHLSWPTPTPPGLAPPFAAGAYDGLLKALVNEHKEHGVLALADPLGRVLSDVVRDLLAVVGVPGTPVLLVPVPSRRPVVRPARARPAAADRSAGRRTPAADGRAGDRAADAACRPGGSWTSPPSTPAHGP